MTVLKWIGLFLMWIIICVVVIVLVDLVIPEKYYFVQAEYTYKRDGVYQEGWVQFFTSTKYQKQPIRNLKSYILDTMKTEGRRCIRVKIEKYYRVK